MKKLYLLILISIFGRTISAQQYYPMLDSVNEWRYVNNNIVMRLQNLAQSSPCAYPFTSWNSFSESTTSDTLIDSLVYKTVMLDNTCIIGYMREDTATRKVYFMDNIFNPEILLYDFSMNVGDTMTLNFVQPYLFFQNGIYTLDSVKTVHILSGFRRLFYLNNHSFPLGYTLLWLESVGNYFEVFYPVGAFGAGGGGNAAIFPHDNWHYLSCFDHFEKVYYDSCAYHDALLNLCFYVQDTCDYGNICGSVHELTSLASITIFPNPSAGKTTIILDVKQKDEFEIIVYDISGKKIVKEISLGKIPEGKKEIELDLSSLTNGFYLVECKSENGSTYGKLLIEK